MTLGELLTALGYAVAGVVLYLAARRRGLATEGMGWVAVAALLGGVFGARLAHWLLVEPNLLRQYPAGLLDPRAGGRTILGGILGGWLAVELAKARLGLRRSTGDLFALALPAGEAVGRIGCLLNGCCYGAACRLPWAIWQHGAWRHPTQLYSAGFCLVLFGGLLALRDRLPREGDLFRVYLLVYGVGRFAIEAFRDQPQHAAGLAPGQWACLGLAAVGAWGLWGRRRWKRA